MELPYDFIYRHTHTQNVHTNENNKTIDAPRTKCLDDGRLFAPNLVFMSILLIFIHVLFKSNSSSSSILFLLVAMMQPQLVVTITRKRKRNKRKRNTPDSYNVLSPVAIIVLKSEKRRKTKVRIAKRKARFALAILPFIPLVPPFPKPPFLLTHYSLTIFYTYLPTLYLPTHPIYKSIISRI